MPRSSRSFALGIVAVLGSALLSACGDPTEPSEPFSSELIAFSLGPPGGDEIEGREIYVVKPDGSGLVQLTAGGMSGFAPAWSPDGTKIAFNRALAEDRNVYVMNADGSGLRAVTTGPAGKLHPSWSPDGESIAYTDGNVLYTVSVDGGDPEVIHEGEFGCQWPAWSPDGSRVVFTGSPDWSSFDVYMSAPDGSDLTLVVSDGVTRSSPSFSPDGSRLLYHQHTEPAGIYVMDLESGEPPERIQEFPDGVQVFATPRWRP